MIIKIHGSGTRVPHVSGVDVIHKHIRNGPCVKAVLFASNNHIFYS